MSDTHSILTLGVSHLAGTSYMYVTLPVKIRCTHPREGQRGLLTDCQVFQVSKTQMTRYVKKCRQKQTIPMDRGDYHVIKVSNVILYFTYTCINKIIVCVI